MCVPPWPILIILGQQVEVVIDPMALNLPVLDHYTLGTVVSVTGLTNSVGICNQLAVNFQLHGHVSVPRPEFGLGLDTADFAGFQLPQCKDRIDPSNDY